MTKNEMMYLVNRSLFATIGYTDELGRQNVRRVFCVWHKGFGGHLISNDGDKGEKKTEEPVAAGHTSDTIQDGHGHRKGWREAADRLEAVYGLQLSPANSAEDLLVPSSLSQVPSVRYVFRCSDCGLIIERYRRSKFVDSPERYRCGNCGGTFEQL